MTPEKIALVCAMKGALGVCYGATRSAIANRKRGRPRTYCAGDVFAQITLEARPDAQGKVWSV